MIQANEIRIGNVVLKEGEILWVGSNTIYNIDRNEDAYDGIPLTKEWLIKFGAKEYKSFGKFKQMIIERENENLICRILENGISLFTICKCNSDELNFINQCKYVHKFQNIAFELGEELTIEEDKK